MKFVGSKDSLLGVYVCYLLLFASVTTFHHWISYIICSCACTLVIVIVRKTVLISTPDTFLSLQIVESSTAVAPVSSTSAVDVIAARPFFSVSLAARAGFKLVDLGEGSHHLGFTVGISSCILLTRHSFVENPLARSTVLLSALRTSEVSFSLVFEVPLTSRIRAPHDLVILRQLLIQGELLILAKRFC